jgi:general secretion pathway protein J
MTRSTSGFTLLDVIAALTVLAAMMLALSEGISYGVIATETQTRLASRREDLDTVARTLRHLIETMDPGTAMEPVQLDAGPHTLTFPTELPASGLAQSEVDGSLIVRHGNLLLRWTPRRHATALRPAAAPRETELLGSVASLEIAYWQPSQSGGAWVETWPRPGLPALIRLRLVFPPGDPRRWPDIVAAPAREAPRE